MSARLSDTAPDRAAMPFATPARGLGHRLAAHYGWILFGLCFVLPVTIAIIFYFLIVADRYISETRFIVRSVDMPAAEGAAAYLQDFGITRASDDAFAIQDYILSRDAMSAIDQKINLRAVFRAKSADFISRYGKTGKADTNEALFKYFKKQIHVEKNLETGITIVRVSTYRPQDSKRIADLILHLSETQVNKMNIRARIDAVSAAQKTAEEAATALASATAALTVYRNQAETVDPQQSAGAAVDRNATLSVALATLRANLAAMVAKAPANPAIPSLRQHIAALDAQAGAVQGELTGSGGSIATKLGNFEGLAVRRELAEKIYEEAERQLDTARETAARQQIYIETVVRPGTPDASLEPRRWRYTFTVALLGIWSFLIMYLLVSGSREHLNMS